MVWLIIPTACRFMMISPKLHAIWAFFFLNLSQNLIVILLIILGPWATANYCRAGIKSLRGTIIIMLLVPRRLSAGFPRGDTRSAKIIRRFDPPFRMAKIRGEGGVLQPIRLVLPPILLVL